MKEASPVARLGVSPRSPGEAVEIPPGHDAWVTGDEPYVGVDVTGAQTYAKRA
jgi:hypothetical protein